LNWQSTLVPSLEVWAVPYRGIVSAPTAESSYMQTRWSDDAWSNWYKWTTLKTWEYEGLLSSSHQLKRASSEHARGIILLLSDVSQNE